MLLPGTISQDQRFVEDWQGYFLNRKICAGMEKVCDGMLRTLDHKHGGYEVMILDFHLQH